jgi:hypothetical protein
LARVLVLAISLSYGFLQFILTLPYRFYFDRALQWRDWWGAANVTRWEYKQKEFLAKAKEAEERAAELLDSANREIWLQIAEDYRDLAQLIEKLKPNE